jgi:hypothetical protein
MKLRKISIYDIKTNKEIQTTYSLGNDYQLHVNEESGEDYMNITELGYGEPCSGILRHWDTKEKLIAELEGIIKRLKEFKQ